MSHLLKTAETFNNAQFALDRALEVYRSGNSDVRTLKAAFKARNEAKRLYILAAFAHK